MPTQQKFKILLPGILMLMVCDFRCPPQDMSGSDPPVSVAVCLSACCQGETQAEKPMQRVVRPRAWTCMAGQAQGTYRTEAAMDAVTMPFDALLLGG